MGCPAVQLLVLTALCMRHTVDMSRISLMNLLPISWLTLDKILGSLGQRQDRLNVNPKGSPAATLLTSGSSRCGAPC